VNRENLERALRLVRREMGCSNARLEIGGDLPDSAEVLCAQMPDGFRLVAVFPEPPQDRAKANSRLKQLAESYFGTTPEVPSLRPDAEEHLIYRRLEDELYALAARTGAVGAFIVDVKSPIVWACSEGRNEAEDFDEVRAWGELVRLARAKGIDLSVVSGLVEVEQATALESFDGETRARMDRLMSRLVGRSLRARRAQLLRAQTLEALRAWTESGEVNGANTSFLRRVVRGESSGYFVRSFAGIYLLVLYFPGGFSELHVEGALLHALPTIEALTLSLPPIDPPPSKGKVLQLRRHG
jgi:hypothetical protein